MQMALPVWQATTFVSRLSACDGADCSAASRFAALAPVLADSAGAQGKQNMSNIESE